jgi:hypothetical protein
VLKVTLLALLVSAAAAPKKSKKPPPPAPPAPAAVEEAPAVPAKAEPEPAPAPAPAPEPAKVEPVAPAPEPAKPAAPEMKPASAVETTKPKLVVLEMTAGGGIDPTVAAALGDAITLEVSRRGYFTATSMKELQTAVGIERQRALVGCSDTAASCMAELADAIGARFVLSGSLTRIGEAYQLSLQTLDTTKAQPIGRSVRIAREPSALIAQVPYAVAEATATSLPPPPSRVLPLTLIIGGGVLALIGAVVGFEGFSRDRAVQAELTSGDVNPSVLRPLASYRDDARAVFVEKTGGLVAVSVGAALIVLGIFLMPPSSPGGSSVAFVPSPNGFAVVGALP